MMQFTEEQMKALIGDVNELRAHLEFWGHTSEFDADFLIQVVDLCISSLNAPPVAALRLPDEKSTDIDYAYYPLTKARHEGWNSCLAEVKRLNATAPEDKPE